MTGDEWEKVQGLIVRFARGTVNLREDDYWMSMSEKVGMERLTLKGMPYGQYCKSEYISGMVLLRHQMPFPTNSITTCMCAQIVLMVIFQENHG